MSEIANTPSTATPTQTTGGDCKSGACGNVQKQPQPQTAAAPASAPMGQKGFKRQGKKQH